LKIFVWLEEGTDEKSIADAESQQEVYNIGF
jgi:hypothetical protein